MKGVNVDLFWAKVEKSDECWNWTAAIDGCGYGRFNVGGKNRRAHKVAYQLAHGHVPKGLEVCHKCDNRRCVNPAHLWLGTHFENMQDCKVKGRYNRLHPFGEQSAHVKLTNEIVLAIRHEHTTRGLTHRELAAKYNVSRQHIGKIINRGNWSHLP